METPNTRARKRFLEASQEAVTWRQDDELRGLISYPSDKPLTLPSPTQRPRPFGSTSSLSSGPCNKRPRRLRASASTNNTPVSTGSERNRLDELLDRFLDVNRPSSSSSSAASASSYSARSSKGVLSERSLNGGSANVTPVGAHRSLPVSMEKGKGSLQRPKAVPRLPLPRSNTPGVRSSPRRATANAAMTAPSPLRAEAPSPAPRRSGSSLAVSHHPPRTNPTTPHRPSTRSAPNLQPQPNSDGDTSVDSLDMMFQGGGEEIEQLLAAVDRGGR